MVNDTHQDQTVAGKTLVPKLQVMKGNQAGKVHNLKFKTRIGRESDNDIKLGDPKISRYHCQISFEDGNWILTDLGSVNGTRLNGMPVNVPSPITHGDQIMLGETIVAFKDPLEEEEIPLDPSDTIVGGPIPQPASAADNNNVPRLAWIVLGLVLLLLLGFGALGIWFNRDPDSTPVVETAPVVGTGAGSSNVNNPLLNDFAVQFEDDFSDSNSGWDDAFGKFYTKQYGNNQYHIEISTNNLVVWGMANRNAADFEVEVEATYENGGLSNTYGLIFRYINHDNYYRFDVTPDGFFLLSKFEEGIWTTLIDWTNSTAINQGEATNVLKISAVGADIALFANGQELARTSDTTFNHGNFGFFASTFDKPNIWVSFDNLRLWGPDGQQIAVIPTPSPTTLAQVEQATGQIELQSSPDNTPEPTSTPTTPPTPKPDSATPTTTSATAEPTPTVEPTATETLEPAPTPEPLPDFVSRDQPLARDQIAFTGKIIFPLYDPARGTYDIYRANPDGSERELLVSEASQPATNIGGDQIAYRSWKADQRGLITRGIGQTDMWLFVQFFEAASPAFSPGQQFFGFHSRQGGNTPAIYRTQGTEHEVLRREGNPIQGEMMSFSPDGRIVYRGCTGGVCGIMLSNLDGANPTQLTAHADDTAPVVSPDGATIAFMSNQDGNWEVYTIGVNGQNLQRLTNNSANDGLPTWSPDGKHIAYASNQDGEWTIWVMTPQGAQKHPLFPLGGSIDGVVQVDIAHSFGWLEEQIVWTP